MGKLGFAEHERFMCSYHLFLNQYRMLSKKKP